MQVYKQNGGFRKGEHIEKQNESINHLVDAGYCCGYAFGFDDAKKIIDNYLINKQDTRQ